MQAVATRRSLVPTPKKTRTVYSQGQALKAPTPRRVLAQPVQIQRSAVQRRAFATITPSKTAGASFFAQNAPRLVKSALAQTSQASFARRCYATGIQEKIAQDIKSAKVVVYMKGTAEAPQCGFSRRVVEVLKKEGVPFSTFNVLSSDELRQGIKDFTSWPTIPQVFIDGEFVGGCDIVEGMHRDGELKTTLVKAGALKAQ